MSSSDPSTSKRPAVAWIILTAAILLLILVPSRLDRAIRLNLGLVELVKSNLNGASPDVESLSSLPGLFSVKRISSAPDAYALGLVQESLGNDGQALLLWERAEELAPSDPLVLFRLGSTWQQVGDVEQAVSYWRRANAYTYWTQQGNWLEEFGDEAAAGDAYRLALRVMPDWAPAAQPLTRILYRQIDRYWVSGELDLAVPALKEVLQLDPRSDDLVRLGGYYSAQGDPDEAMRWYHRGVQLFPAEAVFPLRLGMLSHGQGDLNGAVDHLARAILLEPENSRGYFWLGSTYLKREQLDAAEEALLTSIHLAPDARSYARLGDVYQAQGRSEEAKTAYEQALSRDPDMDYARTRLQALRP